ncbi:MAG: hypothetical protein LBF70_02615, partial [Holosporales bacterium]|nr:hypothetical protein [Holosporales bacterium]
MICSFTAQTMSDTTLRWGIASVASREIITQQLIKNSSSMALKTTRDSADIRDKNNRTIELFTSGV